MADNLLLKIMFLPSIVAVFVFGVFAGAKLVTKMYSEMNAISKKFYILPYYTVASFFFVDKKTKKSYIETPGKMVTVGLILSELPSTAKKKERKELLTNRLPSVYA